MTEADHFQFTVLRGLKAVRQLSPMEENTLEKLEAKKRAEEQPELKGFLYVGRDGTADGKKDFPRENPPIL